jgi:hypothetical protein
MGLGVNIFDNFPHTLQAFGKLVGKVRKREDIREKSGKMKNEEIKKKWKLESKSLRYCICKIGKY